MVNGETRARASYNLRSWNWPQMPIYNGFTHEERVTGWQLIHWLVDNGVMPPAERCSISGVTDRLHYHCEDYYSPWNAYPISQPIHLALHRRFRCSGAWTTIVERHAITGDEWFCRLSPKPIDLAARLRAKHGDDIADVFRRVNEMAALARLKRIDFETGCKLLG